MAGRAVHDGRFSGRVALLTGAASGIGRATAERLAAEGAAVVVTDIDDEAGVQVAAELAAAGATVAYERLDVASAGEWRAVVASTEARHGRLDIVLNNAFTVVIAPAHELAEEDWDRQIDVCLKQVFLSARTCMPLLVQSSGVMINTSSIHAIQGFGGHAGYDAAKGGICALTRTLAVDYGPAVRVNSVLPGGILTNAWRHASEADIERFAGHTVAGRLGRPEEVAAAICFLASDDASYITGENLVVDGGWCISKE